MQATTHYVVLPNTSKRHTYITTPVLPSIKTRSKVKHSI